MATVECRNVIAATPAGDVADDVTLARDGVLIELAARGPKRLT